MNDPSSESAERLELLSAAASPWRGADLRDILEVPSSRIELLGSLPWTFLLGAIRFTPDVLVPAEPDEGNLSAAMKIPAATRAPGGRGDRWRRSSGELPRTSAIPLRYKRSSSGSSSHS
jgi:hypothetical protein